MLTSAEHRGSADGGKSGLLASKRGALVALVGQNLSERERLKTSSAGGDAHVPSSISHREHKLRMASWPQSQQPAQPVPHCLPCMAERRFAHDHRHLSAVARVVSRARPAVIK